jgi:hypothetical protein
MSKTATLKWGVFEFDFTIEVIPLFGKEHVQGKGCWCGPKIEYYDRDLIVHEVEN